MGSFMLRREDAVANAEAYLQALHQEMDNLLVPRTDEYDATVAEYMNDLRREHGFKNDAAATSPVGVALELSAASI